MFSHRTLRAGLASLAAAPRTLLAPAADNRIFLALERVDDAAQYVLAAARPAPTEADPIFAAIERLRAAQQRFLAADKETTPATWKATRADYIASWQAMCDVTPTTVSGMLALIAVCTEQDAGDDSYHLIVPQLERGLKRMTAQVA